MGVFGFEVSGDWITRRSVLGEGFESRFQKGGGTVSKLWQALEQRNGNSSQCLK